MMRALDLFSAAAGGWTLGLHRAGFVTIAACEIVEWRRILYAENNPHVRLYEDVRGLDAARLVSDLGILPDIIVGSPPCQDISSANTKGKGIEGERSGLYLEAIRLVGDCRPRWFAFENSANLRTRGADRLLDELETLGYATEPCVVGASDIGANHVRKRSWLIGYDPGQLAHARIAIPAGRHPSGGWVGRAPGDEGIGSLRAVPQPPAADTDGLGRHEGWRGRRSGIDISAANDSCHTPEIGRGSGWPGRRAEPVAGSCQPPCGHVADAGETEWRPPIERTGDRDRQTIERRESADRHAEPAAPRGGNPADPNEPRQPHGRLEPGLRPPEIADDGCGDGWRDDGSRAGQMGGGTRAGSDAAEPWADWNGGFARHLRLDDGLSAWVADTRIALGSRKGTAAASLIVEAFGDAVLPQIPEAIGRAIPEHWIISVMRAESAGDVHAVSSAGAMGLMQVMPDTWAGLRVRYRLGRDPYDPRENIFAGTAYLREMFDRYGNVGAMLAAYNAGPGRYDEYLATRRILPAETRAYVAALAPVLGGSAGAETPATVPQPTPGWREAPLFVHRLDGNRATVTPPSEAQSGDTRATVPVHDPTDAEPQNSSIFVARSDDVRAP